MQILKAKLHLEEGKDRFILLALLSLDCLSPSKALIMQGIKGIKLLK